MLPPASSTTSISSGCPVVNVEVDVSGVHLGAFTIGEQQLKLADPSWNRNSALELALASLAEDRGIVRSLDALTGSSKI